MFGYVSPFIPELKVKDKELYQSYYCGLCRALGKYGLGSRFSLNYDATFAAVLLSAVTGTEPAFERRSCAAHPSRGKAPMTAMNGIMDFCAAVCVLLAKYKVLDDAHDGRPLRKAALPVFARGVKRAEKKYPGAASVLKEGLKKQEEIESLPDTDPDDAALNFGEVLGSLFSACPGVSPEAKPLLCELGKKLGGYIYIIDAWDDIDEDKKRGSYNVFLLSGFEDPRATCSAMLDMYINSAVLAYDLMDIRVNKPLLDNIMYMGLACRAAEVLRGEGKRRKKKEADGAVAEGKEGSAE